MSQKVPVRVELYSTNSGTWIKIEVNKEDSRFMYYCRASKMTCLVINRVLYINSKDKLISFHFVLRSLNQFHFLVLSSEKIYPGPGFLIMKVVLV